MTVRSNSLKISFHNYVTCSRVTLLLVLSSWTIAPSLCTSDACSLIHRSQVKSLINQSLSHHNQSGSDLDVTEYAIVCLAQGNEQDTWRYVSLVAVYTYNGTNLTSQFQFECVDSNWTATVNGSIEYVLTSPSDASISTTLRTDCALCIDPRQARAANNSHHCLMCDESCSEGLQRCTSQESCCSYFYNNECVPNCPYYSVPGVDNVNCICPSGYNGTECELDINECTDSSLCLNGVCENLNGSYRCVCEFGYTGDSCEVDINDCVTEPCFNGGVCVDGVASFSCHCPEGWTGSVCDVCGLEGCSECVVRQDSATVCVACQQGYLLTVSNGLILCGTVPEPVMSNQLLSSGEVAGIVVAAVFGLVLTLTVVILIVAVFVLYKRRKRLSLLFMQNNVRADQESSASVLQNPVFEADTVTMEADVNIDNDEHFAVNKAALEFEEDND